MGIFLLASGVFILSMILIFVSCESRINEEWTGIIEDKKRLGEGSSANNYIYFLKDAGEVCKYRVTRSLYDIYNIGDRVKKRKGRSFPVNSSL
jgi:hypothetical protein